VADIARIANAIAEDANPSVQQEVIERELPGIKPLLRGNNLPHARRRRGRPRRSLVTAHVEARQAMKA
jgi:hypothetical protein